MRYIPELDIVLILNPKTATRSMLLAFQQGGFTIKRIGSEHSFSVPHGYQKKYALTCVRNPYTRALSWWWSKTQRPGQSGEDFESWIWKKGRDRIPARNRAQIYYFEPATKALRFETLQEDWATFCSNRKLNLPPLPHANASSKDRPEKGLPARPSDEELLTPERAALIRKIYKKDFRNLGYLVNREIPETIVPYEKPHHRFQRKFF